MISKNEVMLLRLLLELLCCVVFILCRTHAFAVTTDLYLTLQLDKETVVLGEPVYLTATLKNQSTKSVAIFPSLFPEDSGLQIEVIGADAKPRSFMPYSLDLNDFTLNELPPGESISAAFSIFYGGRGWTFPNVGIYKISAVFSNPAQGTVMVKSDSVELTVEEDDGGGEFLLQGGTASQEAGKFLMWQSGDHLRAGIAHLKSLIEQYPKSILADYSRLALAHNLSRPFRDYGINKVRKANPSIARKYLEEIIFERLTPYLQVDYIVTESRSYAAQGNIERARIILLRADFLIEKQPAYRVLLQQSSVVGR